MFFDIFKIHRGVLPHSENFLILVPGALQADAALARAAIFIFDDLTLPPRSIRPRTSCQPQGGFPEKHFPRPGVPTAVVGA